ncbi:MAG: Ig-like domain-containing protein, partial [Candidatus Berkelbacteria bacterium]|nr:Ig-like domain-containing protein [Candidatus Berkelbacteria bacterium]
TTLNTTAYSNGGYTLKAVAYDSKQSTQSSISVTFNNASVDTQKPVVTVVEPTANPYSWTSGDLTIRFSAADNVGVTKVQLYINDYLAASVNASSMLAIWPWANANPGTYTLRAKALDAAGNFGEASFVIVR